MAGPTTGGEKDASLLSGFEADATRVQPGWLHEPTDGLEQGTNVGIM